MDTIRSISLGVAALVALGFTRAAESPFITDATARQIGMRVQWSGVLPVPMAAGHPISLRYLVNERELRSVVDLVVDGKTLTSTHLGMIGEGSTRVAKLENGFLEIYAGGGVTLRELHNSAVGDPLGTKPNPQAAAAVRKLVKDLYGDELDSEQALELQRAIDRFKAQFTPLELELMKLKRRGKEGKLVPVRVPETRLYVLGYNGNVVCMDAETGRVIWSIHAGDPNIRPLGMDADDKTVVVVAGPRMFVFAAQDGKEIASMWIEGAPMYGPLLGGNNAFIWTTGGGLYGYQLDNLLDAPFRDISSGGLRAEPVRTPQGRRMGWPTAKGFLYVLETSGQPSVPFRLQPPDPISTSMAPAPKDRLLTVSETGTVYCVNALGSGRVAWRKLIGQTIYDAPIAINNLALVQSLERELFSLDLDTGRPAWPETIGGIAKVLGGDGKDTIYAISVLKDLLVIDSKSGVVKSGIRLGGDVSGMTQNMTDRLFLLGGNGEIQCLRPIESLRPQPIFYLANMATPKSTGQENKPSPNAPAAAPAAQPAPDDNPFGAEAPAMTNDEPVANPFGAPAAGDATDNPFGANPFGL